MKRFAFVLILLGLAVPAHAVLRVDVTGGIQQPLPIAVPAFATPAAVATPAGATADLGRQVAEVEFRQHCIPYKPKRSAGKL